MAKDQSNILPPGQQYYIKLIFKDKYEYNPLNVISIVIKEWVYEILPKVELVLKYDPSVFEQYLIEDNDAIKIILAPSPNSEKQFSIRCMVHDYKISIVGDDRAKVIQITALLDCKNMFISQTKCYSKKTSLQVLQEIANNSNLKFVNLLNVIPADKQNYYQLNQNNHDFIKHIIRRAYIHNDALFFYANHNGEFHYTSLNRERDKKINKTAKFSVEEYSNWTPDNSDTTIWYNSYEIINLQGTMAKETNYGTTNTYYDLKKEVTVEYNNIVPMTDISFVDKEYIGKPTFVYYGGIYNNKNMYSEKYFESWVRNYFLRNNLLGLSMEVNVNPISDVNLFDLIYLNIDSKISKSVDKPWSGFYLIVGIVYFVTLNGTFQKRIFISRNGINLPDQKSFIPRNF